MLGRNGCHPSIQRRRRDENTRRRYLENAISENKNRHIANWQNRSQQLINTEKVKESKRRDSLAIQQKLQQRRDKLRTLLYNEDVIYSNELEQQQETAIQRSMRLHNEAKKRKEQREKRRIEEAQNAYNRRWELGCDDLRRIESDASLKKIIKERGEQLNRQTLQKEEEAKKKKAWDAMKLEEFKRIKEQEKEEAQKKAEWNEYTKRELLNQIDELKKKKKFDQDKKEYERLLFKKQIEIDAAHDKERALADYTKRKKEQDEVLRFNREIQERKRLEKETHDRLAKKNVQNLMMQQAEEDNKRLNEKLQLQQDFKAYGKYLEVRKRLEKENERQLEESIKKEMENINARRDQQSQKQNDARIRLQHQVHASRFNQIMEKKDRKNRENKKRDEELYEIHNTINEFSIKQQSAADQRKQQQQERIQYLKHQIKEKKTKQKLKKFREQREYEQYLENERQYKQMVAQKKASYGF